MLKALGALFTFAILAAISGAGFGYVWLRGEVTSPGPLAEETVFRVAPGENLNSVASRAQDAGILADPLVLRLHARLTGQETALKIGEYPVPVGISPEGFLDLLVEGDVVQHTITLPEGLTTAQILQRIASDSRLEGALPDPPPEEGSLLPETYAFTAATTKADFIARLQAAQAARLAALWDARAPGLPYETPEEALIMASIVQKEAGGAGEYGNVASVFINRLERGMKLETDVAVHYGVNGGAPLRNARGERRTLYRSELDRDTPYNTYTREGLPPTPICNPGEGALEAALNPPDTDFIFFVADGRGGSVFTTNYSDHQRAVAAYRAYERAEIARERGN